MQREKKPFWSLVHYIFKFCGDFVVHGKRQTGTTAISSCVPRNICAPNARGGDGDLLGKAGGWERQHPWAGVGSAATQSCARPEQPCWEGSMKWWSKWGSLVHNSWAETNLCTRQDHLLNFPSMEHCLLAPHKIHLTPQGLNGSSTSHLHYSETMPLSFF